MRNVELAPRARELGDMQEEAELACVSDDDRRSAEPQRVNTFHRNIDAAQCISPERESANGPLRNIVGRLRRPTASCHAESNRRGALLIHSLHNIGAMGESRRAAPEAVRHVSSVTLCVAMCELRIMDPNLVDLASMARKGHQKLLRREVEAKPFVKRRNPWERLGRPDCPAKRESCHGPCRGHAGANVVRGEM